MSKKEEFPKFYQFGDSYFEVLSKELMMNKNAYQIECKRAVTNLNPEYIHGNRYFFEVSLEAKPIEISEVEFIKELCLAYEDAARKIAELEIQNINNMAFMLPHEIAIIRRSYSKTFGHDIMNKHHMKLLKEIEFNEKGE